MEIDGVHWLWLQHLLRWNKLLLESSRRPTITDTHKSVPPIYCANKDKNKNIKYRKKDKRKDK